MLHRARLLIPLVVFLMMAGTPVSGQEPNITYRHDPNFAYPLTPTTTFPTPIPVVLPATLPGNADAVYWNFIGHNNGAASTNADLGGTFSVDGVVLYGWGLGAGQYINPGQSYAGYDKGPINVRGGRHTLHVMHDDLDLISESDENDNLWGRQFIFTPYVLSEGTPKDRGAPPDPVGGLGSIIDYQPVDYNCDGFRFSNTGWWNAIVMYEVDDGSDFDLDLYSPSTGSENGFINSLANSFAPGGQLDAVIVNSNMVPVQDFDVGVTNMGGSSHFVIEHVVSESAWVGKEETVSFGTDEYLKIWDTYIGSAEWVTVAVTDFQVSGTEFRLGWFDYDETVTRLTALTNYQVPNDQGEIRFHRDFTTTGYYGLVIYRSQAEGGDPVDLNLRIEQTPPDLKPIRPHFWHSELVPTSVPIVPGYHAALPDTLHGYVPQTYLNFCAENGSPSPSSPGDAAVYQDGMDFYFIPYFLPAMSAYDTYVVNDGLAYEYPGGRHTLTVDLDYNETIHEIFENNNVYGEQYCWSPLELHPGQQYSRHSPGYVFGGWETVDSGEVFYYNCDGYRLMTGNSQWDGVVLTQGPDSDYDLSVHFKLEGVKDGFDDYLAFSEMVAGQTDYVLFNNSVVPPGAHDVGVENLFGGDSYTIEAVGSASLQSPTDGNYGPFTMPISNMLQLHNVYLEQDTYAFRLDNYSGGADWSMGLHSRIDPRPGRIDAVLGGYSNQNGSGGPEWFTLDIATADWYCLAVCKATPFDFDLEGTYGLTILRGVSDVTDEQDLPSATSLAGVHPNPFNPQTTISFDLANRATVELDLYDVKGALMRRLVDQSMPAGRHSAVWNGKDDSGTRVASGVYLARFTAGQHREVQKVVMVK